MPEPTTGEPVQICYSLHGPAWHVEQGRRLDVPVLFGQGATDNLCCS